MHKISTISLREFFELIGEQSLRSQCSRARRIFQPLDSRSLFAPRFELIWRGRWPSKLLTPMRIEVVGIVKVNGRERTREQFSTYNGYMCGYISSRMRVPLALCSGVSFFLGGVRRTCPVASLKPPFPLKEFFVHQRFSRHPYP